MLPAIVSLCLNCKILLMNRFFKSTVGKDFLAILLFLVVGVIYFYPVLSGYDLRMGDVSNGGGMSGFLRFFYQETGDMAFWSPNTFLGMPSYILYFPNEFLWIKEIPWKLFGFLGLGLGGFLIMCIGFYTLLKAFRFGPLLSAGGAFLYAFSGYFILVLSAGHFNKVYAIGAFPILFAGIVHILKGNKTLGYLTTTIGALIALASNHPQIFYYFSWILGIFLLVDLILEYKKGAFSPAFNKLLPVIPIVLIALLNISEGYYNTYHYSKDSIRGQNDLAEFQNEKPESGLDLDYMTQWSYGVEESWNLIIPGFKGGGSKVIGPHSALKDVPANFRKNIEQSSLYWGNQPFTGGPAYLGIVAFILFLFGMVFIQDPRKWVFFGLSVLALMLAWGKNFVGLTTFFADYFPLYKKFRAVTMIHSIIELSVPLVGIWFLSDLAKGKIVLDKKKTLAVSGSVLGLLAIFYVGGSGLFSFFSDREIASFAQQANSSAQMKPIIEQFQSFLKQTRLSIFKADVLRAILFAGGTTGAIYLYFKQKIKINILIYVVLGLGIIDLIQADKRVLNTDKVNGEYAQFEPKKDGKSMAFQPTGVDVQILRTELNQNPTLKTIISQVRLSDEDKKSKENKEALLLWRQLNTLNMHTNYRVLDLTTSPFMSARASYFHKSVGGYHAAKMRKAQNMFDFHFAGNSPTPEVLKTLNVKYISTPSGLSLNDQNYGPAWMVSNVRVKENPYEIITALGKEDLSTTALISDAGPELTGKVFDTTRAIISTSFSPDTLAYTISGGGDAFIALSEMYYEHGWKAFYNAEEVPIYNINYWMRGVEIPKSGTGELTLIFHPESFSTLRFLSIAGNYLVLLALIFFGYKHYSSKGKKRETLSTEANE